MKIIKIPSTKIQISNKYQWSKLKIYGFVKSQKRPFLSFRRKPESSVFKNLRLTWTPAFDGVTAFYEIIKI